jgi:hypothetical protein
LRVLRSARIAAADSFLAICLPFAFLQKSVM